MGRRLGSGTLYAWRVDGPYPPGQRDRCNRHRLLLDPYANALAGTGCRDFARACSDHELYADADDAAVKPRCLVADGRFDREGDLPPGIPWSDTVIYETRVRGLTIHPSSAVRHPGTFQGMTAIELLPVIICV